MYLAVYLYTYNSEQIIADNKTDPTYYQIEGFTFSTSLAV